jgi:predicted GNAT family N-acyltransferase
VGYRVTKVEWDRQKDQLQQIRERVFVYELHIPKRVEFDNHDKLALHVLVTDDTRCPVATARLCDDGLISRLAVLPEHRNRKVYCSLLNYIFDLATEQGIESISVNCVLHEVERFIRNGFIKQGNVFMEAGIPRQRLKCPVRCADTTPFTLVH